MLVFALGASKQMFRLDGPTFYTAHLYGRENNFDHEDEYVIRLSDDDSVEIQQALDYFNSKSG